jgi:hypothetical protein
MMRAVPILFAFVLGAIIAVGTYGCAHARETTRYPPPLSNERTRYLVLRQYICRAHFAAAVERAHQGLWTKDPNGCW